ncbi:MAG TPA: histidine phosphatase family protein [Acidimicrobiales bacterium]|nr:histidine phosphatase family protein [Acidimicrobiales bacterium]
MLIFVRHGECEANAAGVLVGRSNSSLTEFGRWQAAAIGRSLVRTRGADTKPVRLLTSPLERAVETAQVIASVLRAASDAAVEPEVDDRLIELDYGRLEGTVIHRSPVDTPSWVLDPTVPLPGGEPLAAVAERVATLCRELSSTAGAGDVVLVTHVSPAKAAVAWALGCDVTASWRMSLGLASVTRIDPKLDRPLLVSFNETWHVMDAPDTEAERGIT